MTLGLGTRAASQAILKLYDHPGMRERMGKAARARIATNFRIEDTIEKTIAVYQSLVSKPTPSFTKEMNP